LSHLKRQAQSAERYGEYKEQERELKSQLLVLQRRAQNNVATRAQREIDEFATERERYQAQVSSSISEIESLRQQITDANASTSDLQGAFYALGSEVSRIEQTIKFAKQRRDSLARDLEQTLEGKQRELGLVDSDSQRLTELAEALSSIEPTLARERDEVVRVDALLLEAEKAAQTADGKWENFTQQAALPKQQVEVQQGRKANAERNLATLSQRLDRIKQELESLSGHEETKSVDAIVESLLEAEAAAMLQRDELEKSRQALSGSRDQLGKKREEQDELRRQSQVLAGQKASLEALQADAKDEQAQAEVNAWLQAMLSTKGSSLLELVSVASGYEAAADLVLGAWVSSAGVDLEQLKSDPVQPPAGLSMIDAATSESNADTAMLAHYIKGPVGITYALAGIRVVETWQQAMAERLALSDGESVVSKDGLWVGRSWIRSRTQADAEQGMIARQGRLTEISERLEKVSTALAEVDKSLLSLRQQRADLEQDIDVRQEALQSTQQKVGQLASQKRALITEKEQRLARESQLKQDLLDAEVRVSEEQAVIEEATQMLGRARSQVASDETSREELEDQRQAARDHVRQCRQAKQQADVALNRSEVRHRELLTQREALAQSIERARQQLETYEQREASIRNEMPTEEDPDREAQYELSELLEKRLGVETQLTQARQGLSELENALREREQIRMQAEQAVAGVQTRSEGARLKLAETAVRIEQIDAALRELETTLEQAEALLPEEADESEWQVRVERMGAKIHRLGPINLAAIDETSRAEERKQYLDAQDDDLRTALETLQNAIKKIDKETRSRFKDTFDTVNAGFSELFPRVFGGGTACLEMTGDDLLDTGVTIMARPPGKKNSTIHLLSGGEKAMTAIALVFSIFQLNPAPFCMLDEVDAPLDDANVGRYARLVSEMSRKVQFVFITHNKITMEAAEQLMGVTMHEPGVSRLVTVDIEEAARLAAS